MYTNQTGNSNTGLGRRANVGSNNLTNATAIGANAQVNTSNSVVLGSINGVNGATADTRVGSRYYFSQSTIAYQRWSE